MRLGFFVVIVSFSPSSLSFSFNNRRDPMKDSTCHKQDNRVDCSFHLISSMICAQFGVTKGERKSRRLTGLNRAIVRRDILNSAHGTNSQPKGHTHNRQPLNVVELATQENACQNRAPDDNGAVDHLVHLF